MSAQRDDALAGGAAQGTKTNGKADAAIVAQRTTSAERAELSKLLRLRARVAHSDAKARAAEQMAIFEQQLATEYPENHPAWAGVIAKAKATLRAVEIELTAECDRLNIPLAFRPSFNGYWDPRGQNAYKERRAELRAAAQRFVTANATRACVEVDRTVAALQTQLLSGAAMSADGKTFLDAMPVIDDLLPAPTLDIIKQLAHG